MCVSARFCVCFCGRLLDGGDNTDGLSTDGQVLVGTASTSHVTVGHTGATVTVQSSELLVDSPVTFTSTKRVTATANLLRLGVDNNDFTLLHSASAGTPPALVLRGASVDVGGGVFQGGALVLDGGSGTTSRGPVTIRGGNLQASFDGTSTLSSVGKLTMGSTGGALDLTSSGTLLVDVTNAASEVRVGLSASAVRIGATGTTTTVNSAVRLFVPLFTHRLDVCTNDGFSSLCLWLGVG